MSKMREAFERKYQMPWATAPINIKEDFEAGYQAAIADVKAGGAVAYNHYYEDFSHRIAKAADPVAQASIPLYKLPKDE
jgi:hypothetical protein